jgi:hypothetical protein
MQALQTTARATATGPETPSPLERMYAAIRAATRVPADWQTVVDAVIADLSREAPPADDVLRQIPARTRRGSDRSQVLHVEPDGSFSVVALISRPGQATSCTTTRPGAPSLSSPAPSTKSGSVST